MKKEKYEEKGGRMIQKKVKVEKNKGMKVK